MAETAVTLLWAERSANYADRLHRRGCSHTRRGAEYAEDLAVSSRHDAQRQYETEVGQIRQPALLFAPCLNDLPED